MNRQSEHNAHQRAYYTRAERSTIAAGRTPYIDRHVDEALRAAQVADGASIIDVGCGRGRHAFLLAERGFRVEGLELSEDLLQKLRAEDRFGLPAHCGDIAEPPAALRGRFDGVLGFFVLHHLLDLGAAFRGIAALAKPGGRVAFVEPNPYNASYWLQITLSPSMRWSAERGIFNMRRRPIFNAMRAAGLQNPALHRFGILPPALRNQSWGGAVDAFAESVTPMRPLLAFQVFSAQKAP
jgi:SAM-dependent methyltransferase